MKQFLKESITLIDFDFDFLVDTLDSFVFDINIFVLLVGY